MELKFAELHTALFLAGTNLGLKLQPTRRSGLALAYDREHKELHVTYNNEMAIVPTTNVASMTPGRAPEDAPVAASPLVTTPAPRQAAAPKPVIKATAQATTPQSHVFEGPGGGKTGQEGNRK